MVRWSKLPPDSKGLSRTHPSIHPETLAGTVTTGAREETPWTGHEEVNSEQDAQVKRVNSLYMQQMADVPWLVAIDNFRNLANLPEALAELTDAHVIAVLDFL